MEPLSRAKTSCLLTLAVEALDMSGMSPIVNKR
jgi:hypothetical protein